MADSAPTPSSIDSMPIARFDRRHIGPQPDERDKMLAALGLADLTELATSGARLLDEATAVAEAMTLARRSTKTGSVFLLDGDTLPQTVGVVRTRAAALGLGVVVADGSLLDALEQVDAFGVLVQTPGASGRLAGTDELAAIAERAHEQGALVVAACDLLALTLTTPPGEWGAD